MMFILCHYVLRKCFMYRFVWFTDRTCRNGGEIRGEVRDVAVRPCEVVGSDSTSRILPTAEASASPPHLATPQF